LGIIADIHSNALALKEALEHMKSNFPIKEIYCLGDLVGHFSHSKETLKLIRSDETITMIVKGDRDHIASMVNFFSAICSFTSG